MLLVVILLLWEITVWHQQQPNFHQQQPNFHLYFHRYASSYIMCDWKISANSDRCRAKASLIALMSRQINAITSHKSFVIRVLFPWVGRNMGDKWAKNGQNGQKNVIGWAVCVMCVSWMEDESAREIHTLIPASWENYSPEGGWNNNGTAIQKK